jgi:hypothetical protein
MAGFGFHRDVGNTELDIQVNGTVVLTASATALTIPAAVTSGLTISGGGLTVTGRLTASSFLSLGAAGADVDIASGVLTVTKPYNVVAAESGTTDQVDTITYTSAAEGDILVLESNTTDTITYDDANIDLGGATRACAPGGKMFLIYDGASWSEIAFVASADNA